MKDLLSSNFLTVGQDLFDKNNNKICNILENGSVTDGEEILSIHKMSAKKLNKVNNNGWDYFYILRNESLIPLNSLRYEYSK